MLTKPCNVNHQEHFKHTGLKVSSWKQYTSN